MHKMNVTPVSKYSNIMYFHFESNDVIQKVASTILNLNG